MNCNRISKIVWAVVIAVGMWVAPAWGQRPDLEMVFKWPIPTPEVTSPLKQVVVQLPAELDPRPLAQKYNCRITRTLKTPGFYVWQPNRKDRIDRRTWERLLTTMKADATFMLVAENRQVTKQITFQPNDPFFGPNSLGGQWHLKNENSTIDANLQGAWDAEITGTGIVVGIVDDGLQINHPDLGPNVRTDLSFDFGQNDSDPSPVSSSDNHGTSVAGVAAARGGNEIGVSGAAPFGLLAGLRIDFGSSTDADFADATLFQSVAIPIKNHSYGFSTPFVVDEIQAAAVSATPETIHCFSAGNGRGTSGQDSGKEQIHNLPNVVNVAAIASNGIYSDYSSFGANVIVTAPSDGVLGITTTDRTGSAGYNNGSRTSDYRNSDGPNAADYTATFGGTSSSSPLVAGILALARESQPELNYRIANHLLVLTGRKVDPDDSSSSSDGGWRTNGAGHEFNQNYGFGMIDATALVEAAGQFEGATELQTESTGRIPVNRPINESTPVTVEFDLTSDTPLEDLFVNLQVNHTYRGDLSAYLTSPSGFRSRLFSQAGSDAEANLSWTFRTVAFWGESPQGTWTLELIDNFNGDAGTFENFEVVAAMGELIPTVILGDANGDGFFDFGDLEPFALALTDPDRFALEYPNVDPNRNLDFDGDGQLTFGDIDGFVNGLLE